MKFTQACVMYTKKYILVETFFTNELNVYLQLRDWI